MFFKIGTLKNLTKFKGKHLCRNLFLIKFTACCVQPAVLFKKGLLRWCFPVILSKFLMTPFVTEHLHTTCSVQAFTLKSTDKSVFARVYYKAQNTLFIQFIRLKSEKNIWPYRNFHTKCCYELKKHLAL